MIFDKPLLLGKGALDIANMDFFSSHTPHTCTCND